MKKHAMSVCITSQLVRLSGMNNNTLQSELANLTREIELLTKYALLPESFGGSVKMINERRMELIGLINR